MRAGGKDRSGLTVAEVLEYCIYPSSQHEINRQINDDIEKLRDLRWPW